MAKNVYISVSGTNLPEFSPEKTGMPRRPSNVNQADTQRVIRAFKREKVDFRVTLQPNGAAVFDIIAGPIQAPDEPTPPEDLRGLL
jgi:hypothetical protein